MAEHTVGTREEYQAAHEELLKQEKEVTRRGDELAKKRRELPWVAIEEDYRFQTDDGEKSLAELFDGRSQLLMYHFMFGPSYESGCPMCSAGADFYDRAVPHLNARDVTFLCASRGPLEKLQAFKGRMGWTFPWVSAGEGEFSHDFGAFHTEEELAPFLAGEMPPTVELFADLCGTDPASYVAEGPALTAFVLDDGTVYQAYSTSARGLEPAILFYPLLDRTAFGRHEEDDPEFWVRRHDEYGD